MIDFVIDRLEYVSVGLLTRTRSLLWETALYHRLTTGSYGRLRTAAVRRCRRIDARNTAAVGVRSKFAPSRPSFDNEIRDYWRYYCSNDCFTAEGGSRAQEVTVSATDRYRSRGDSDSGDGRDRNGSPAAVGAIEAPPDAMQSDARPDGPRTGRRRSAPETAPPGSKSADRYRRWISASREMIAIGSVRDDTAVTLHRSGDRSVLEAVGPPISMSARSFTAMNCSRPRDYYGVATKVTAHLHDLFRRRRGISSAGNFRSSESLSGSA